MATHDYERIDQAIRYLEDHFQEQPELKDLAAHLGLSEFHFQRLFQRWAGISPKRFLQFLTIQHAKGRLRESASVLDATFDAGLSSPSRLHDLFVTLEAVTPGQYKTFGKELTISYGFHATPFGEALLAVTERGVCGLEFVTDNDHEALIANLHSRWPDATVIDAPARTSGVASQLFTRTANGKPQELRLLVKGTNFQVRVWEALLKIPEGAVVSYGELAGYLGNAKASRAVGSAVGKNTIGFLIPCHRAIQSSGVIHRYRWGSTRKKAMLAWESARSI